MRKLVVAGIAFIFSLGVTITVNAAGDAAKGKASYAVCLACHGANGEGNTLLNAPLIGGQSVWYIERQLKNFKAGIRGGDPKDIYGAQMRPMAMTLVNDEVIADVAAYVTSLKPPKPAATLKGDAAAGKVSYPVCLACHGVNGEGNKMFNSPRITGQQDWYVVRQLQNFKAGIRGTNPKDIFGMQMRPMAMTLATDEMIHNMAAYLSTLK